MRPGHAEAQRMFLEIGVAQGFTVRTTYSRSSPTDGVWFAPTSLGGHEELPVAALEVAVSEAGKVLAGSIAALEAVSPALGVLVIQTDEIARGLVRGGRPPEAAAADVAAKLRRAHELADRSRQRIVVWTFEQLLRRYEVTTGRASLFVHLRLARAP